MAFLVAVVALPAVALLLAMVARMEHFVEGEQPSRSRFGER